MGFEGDAIGELSLAMLRARCPDCGNNGREANVVVGEPDAVADPALHDVWLAAVASWADEASRPAPVRHAKVGRNDSCPCGSGRKHKRCCA